MGSAIVTDMVATCGAAAKQLFTMRFRRRRLRRYVAATAWQASDFVTRASKTDARGAR